MKILISTAAAFFALTGTAYAQEAETPKMACCEKMKEEGKKCCCAKEGEGEHNMSEHADGQAH